MRKNLFRIAVFVAVVGLELSACGPKVVPATKTAAPGSPEPTEKKIITIAWTQEPNSLNRSYSSMWGMWTLSQIYSCSPWQFDENNEPYPYMVTELPTVSDDGLVVTMHLRDDLVWSDGTPLTSRSVHVLDEGKTIAEGLPNDVRHNSVVINSYLGNSKNID
ncbi:MAG: ABC transporter substrate-binding protein [Chloroflexi bacterium]|nr:ABC transporter substrate-binding protein [Chloroflexota bacterium]